MKYTNIFFDLDGTLTDSGEGIMNSAKYAFEQLGIKVPDNDELRKMVGPPLTTSFPLFGVPENRVDEAIVFYRDMYNNHGGKYQNSLYPGIEDMLNRLKEAGYRLFIATSKPEALAREIVERFNLTCYFGFIAGATLDRSRESKNDVLKYLMKEVKDSNETVMVGDTSYDVIGAQKENLPCIGVSWGYGKENEMIKAGAVKIVSSPSELLEYLLT